MATCRGNELLVGPVRARYVERNKLSVRDARYKFKSRRGEPQSGEAYLTEFVALEERVFMNNQITRWFIRSDKSWRKSGRTNQRRRKTKGTAVQ